MGRLPAISIEGLHMSRHYFNTFHKGSPISVILGWDRPMNYFFLVIEEQNNSADNPMTLDLLYSNLQERSEEHTSELQSLMRISYAVFCLKKKKKTKKEKTHKD